MKYLKPEIVIHQVCYENQILESSIYPEGDPGNNQGGGGAGNGSQEEDPDDPLTPVAGAKAVFD